VLGHGNNVTDVSAKELEFLSNETIEGESLANRLAQGGLPAEEALRFAIDIGAALNRAHKRGAVHGKLSPHAVLLTASGARLVRPLEDTDLNALPYRSPEQVSGAAPDWRSDIFSFGTLLYERQARVFG
jgi:serine/threonine protein kinase